MSTPWSTARRLGGDYRDAGRPAEAIAILAPALRGLERVLGPDHFDTSNTRRLLNLALEDAGRPAEAIAVRAAVFEERRKRLGPDHDDTLRALADMIGASGRADRLDDAGFRRLEEILKAQEAAKGTDEPAPIGTASPRRRLSPGRPPRREPGCSRPCSAPRRRSCRPATSISA